MQLLKPCGSLLKRGDGGDDFVHLDLLRREQLDAARDLAGGGAGTLQAELAGDDNLKREFGLRRKITDERDGAAFAHRVDRGKDRGVEADAFKRGIRPLPLRQRFHELGEVAAGLRIKAVGRAKFQGDGEARVFSVDGNHLRKTRNLRGLKRQQTNHAGAHDDGGITRSNGR